MKIALVQFNPKVGDLKNNAKRILQKIAECQEKDSELDLIVFPELSLIGYPPKDLLLNKNLLIESWDLLNSEIIPQIIIPTLLGIISPNKGFSKLYNSLALIEDKQLKKIFHKKLLPNYEVFNEARYFESGNMHDWKLEFKGHEIAVLICEDLLATETDYKWTLLNSFKEQKINPDLIICASASPYRVGQPEKRIKAAINFKCPVALVNQVGANDDLIFDGSSFFLNRRGQIAKMAKSFEENILIFETNSSNIHKAQDLKKTVYEIREAVVLGIKDYFAKTGFQKALIGISGGVDSALVAALAAQALGSKNIIGILMPSKYSSEASIKDSEELLKNFNIQAQIISIENILKSFLAETGLSTLTLAEENLQSRIRGSILMALANENKALVLATGNKSEFSVGYSTLYGDMCGALAPIGDLWKTQVWELAKTFPEIPRQIIQKPPSAELRPNQLDTDSLPEYELLDKILKGFIEYGLSIKQLEESGLPSDAVHKVFKLFSQSEFKRKQAPIILKVSQSAFGSGWLYPVAASF